MRYLVKFKDGRKTAIDYDGSLNDAYFDDMGYLRGEDFIINLNDVIYIIPFGEDVHDE